METGIKELPTFLDFFLDMHRHFLGLTLHQWVPVIMSILVIVSLVLLCHLYTRRLERVPGSVQALLELVVEFLDEVVKSNMGKKVGEAFVPLIGTLFIYIWVMNLMGQVPLFHSPTANYNTTLALTLIVFSLTHYHGLKSNGLLGYLKHLMGEPKWMAPLMFPLHLIQEIISRPLSLSMRLFGNLTGEDTILAIFVGFAPFLLGFIPLPIQLPMAALDLLLATLQAAVFAILATVYISSAIGLEEEKH